MRISFDQDLKMLHEEIVKMLSMTEEAIDQAMVALKNQDVELAKKVIAGDDIIDSQEAKIEKLCLDIIVRQAPLAGDLRKITSIFKLITDLERIADHAEDISAIVVKIYNERLMKPLIDLPKMANIARAMVSKVIAAYMQGDMELALQACRDDQIVDDYYVKIYNELIEMMKSNPAVVEQGVALITIAKYLERIADHATNIGEWAVFSESGKHPHL
jgi:phosphate transport system protein